MVDESCDDVVSHASFLALEQGVHGHEFCEWVWNVVVFECVCVVKHFAERPCDLVFDGGSWRIVSPGGVWDVKIDHGAWPFEVFFGFLLQCVVYGVGYEWHVDERVVQALDASVAGWNVVESVFVKKFVHVFITESQQRVAFACSVHVFVVFLEDVNVVDADAFAGRRADPHDRVPRECSFLNDLTGPPLELCLGRARQWVHFTSRRQPLYYAP